ncbi:MAG: nucleotide exchange factor GrpE, partial [Firmicutes bacterium]|nr:nucleotide exchange factor GrpE [Bacillota bacterium]
MSKKNKDTIGATAAGVASNVRGGGETEQLLTEKELQLELAAKQRDEYLQLAQRLKADYENLKKRADALAPKVREDTLVSVIETLLPVFDNLLLAKNGITDASIAKGIDLILKQFHDTLTTLGI